MKKQTSVTLLKTARRLSKLLPGRWQRRLRELGKVILNYRGARKSAMKVLQFSLAARKSPFLVAPFGIGVMIVDSSDKEIGRTVYIRGDYERIYMETAVAYLRRRGGFSPVSRVFVDVGANIGTSTVDALLHFGFGRALCFEPDVKNFTLLQANLLINELQDRAVAHRVAVSDDSGTATLELSPDNSGDHRVVNGPVDRTHRWSAVTVPCGPLDGLVADAAVDLDDVGLVWVDTQGFEAFVLQGAPKVMAAGVPVVIEYWPDAMSRNGSIDLLEKLVAANYSTVVDLRLLSHGIENAAILPAARIYDLRARYGDEELTDLLLIA